MVVLINQLSDEEIENLTDEEKFKIGLEIEKEKPVELTIGYLLESNGVVVDDIDENILSMRCGLCNSVRVNDESIVMYRENSKIKDNITINLKDTELAYMIYQMEVTPDFIHEEGYDKNGLLLYRS